MASWCRCGRDLEHLLMFSGDIDLSERTDSMPWSQWSLSIRSYFGKFKSDGSLDAAASENKRGRSDHH